MASQFYSRYIPPTSGAVHADVDRPVKKRKKLKPKGDPLQASTASSAKVDEVSEAHALPTAPDRAESPIRKGHQNVLDKYAKGRLLNATSEQSIAYEAKSSKKSSKSGKEHANSKEDDSIGNQDREITPQTHGLEPIPQPDLIEPDSKPSTFSALPEWLRTPIAVPNSATVPFNDLAIHKQTLTTLHKKGYEEAFAIQSSVLPMLLPGSQQYQGDICISAATGSGKTLAYVLPIIEALRENPVTQLQGLIIVPTRELINQVKETFDLCKSGTSLKIGAAIGSTSFREEQASLIHKGQRYDPEAFKAQQELEMEEDEELSDWDFDKYINPQDDIEIFHNHVPEYTSKVDILICTPGRLVEHIQSTKGFTLQHVKWLVIDEADQLLDESFQQWVGVVVPALKYLPPLDPLQERISKTFHLFRRRELQKIVLSATMTKDVSKLTPLKLRRPRLVVLERASKDDSTSISAEVVDPHAEERLELPGTLEEVAIKVSDTNDKPLYLIKLLDAHKNDLKSNSKVTRKRKSKRRTARESIDSNRVSSDDSRSTANSEASFSKSLEQSLSSPPHPATRGTLIFTKTNEHATRLACLLSLINPDSAKDIATLTKSSASSKARKTLSSFQKGKISILIASDRASRGLDIPDLALVINYDIPPSLTSYVHRVGRTARAGKAGVATTLVAENEARWFWNEIARSERVGRGEGRRVVRDNTRFEFGEELRRRYEEALEMVGKEARGQARDNKEG